MKILKIISIVSYLCITGLGEHGVPMFALLFMYIYKFISDIVMCPANIEIFWKDGLLAVLTVIILFFILINRMYNKYILLSYIAVLIVLGLYFSGLFYRENYQKLTIHFLAFFIVFLGSSSYLIVYNFKKS